MGSQVRKAFLLLSTLAISGCLPYTRARIEPGDKAEISTNGRAREVSWFSGREAARRQSLKLLTRFRSNTGQRDYHVLPGDSLAVNIRAVEEERVTYRVSGAGTVTLPLLKRVKVAGKTPEQIEEMLSEAYKKYYMEPEVSVAVSEFHGRPVSILGQVDHPGTLYLTSDEVPLTEVLSSVGSFRGEASDRVILVMNDSGDGNKLYRSHDAVPESSVQWSPEGLSRDAAYELEADGSSAGSDEVLLRVSSSEPSAPDRRAGLGHPDSIPAFENAPAGTAVEIFREELTGDIESAPLSISVRAGDTVFLPPAGKVHVQGEVLKPGTIPLAEKMTVLGAIAGAGGIRLASNDTAELTRTNPDGTTVSTVIELKKAVGNPELDIRLQPGDMVRLPSSPFWYVVDSVVNFFPRLGLNHQIQ